MAVPSLFPQLASAVTKLTVMRPGSLSVMELVSLHPLLSVLITIYDPSHNDPMDAVVCPPGLQEYMYGEVPPIGEEVAVPSQLPGQEGSAFERLDCRSAGCETVVVVCVEHPDESVTVTV